MGLLEKPELIELFGFLTPGIIIVFFLNLVKPGPRIEYKFLILHYVVASTFYFIFVQPIFHFDGGVKVPSLLHSTGFYLIAPTILGLLGAYCSQSERPYQILQRLGIHAKPTIEDAWDYTFYKTLGNGRYAIVTLLNGNQIYGYIGPSSYVSSSRERSDLLLENVFILDSSDEWVQSDPPRSIYIKGEQISHIELIWSEND